MLLSNLKSDSVLQLVAVILLFVFVLAITWFTTRWISKLQKGQMSPGKNIEVIETAKITPDKYIQIVRTGDKYLVIGVGKSEVSFLTELNSDEIEFKEESPTPSINFASVLERVKNLKKSKDD